jgi:hypothetical protein
MESRRGALLGLTCVLALNGQMLGAQEKADRSTAQVHVVITDVALRSDSELPRLRQDEGQAREDISTGHAVDSRTGRQRCPAIDDSG